MSTRKFEPTPEQAEYLRTHYPATSNRKLAQVVGVSAKTVAYWAKRNGLEKCPKYAKRHAGAFRASRASLKNRKRCPVGTMPHNHVQVGTERVRSGYIEIKTAEPATWKAKQVHIWEQVNGPLPDSLVVAFKDGNNRNFELKNLEAVSRAEVMSRNTINRYPPELQGLAIQLGKMKKRISEVENDNDARH